MTGLAEKRVNCPYCGEFIDVLIDPSVSEQEYVEDCQVCCNPIIFTVAVLNGRELQVVLSREND